MGITNFSASGPSEVVEETMAELLRQRGYTVEKVKPWETVRSLCRRLAIPRKRFNRALDLPDCPPVDLQRSGTGRILTVASNAAFDTFVSRPRYYNRQPKS